MVSERKATNETVYDEYQSVPIRVEVLSQSFCLCFLHAWHTEGAPELTASEGRMNAQEIAIWGKS